MDRLRRSALSLGLLIALLGLATGPVLATPQETITVASTTSTEQSGLFKDLLPKFTLASGIAVKVVALGTGQALDAARRGDADVALVHDTTAEEKFVSEGWSTKRYPVMYNDFVIVGPKDDPAGAAGASVVEALRKIAAAKAPFVSRGDRSGTHTAELRYWNETGPRSRRGTRRLVQGCGSGNGAGAQYCIGLQCLSAHRPGHLAVIQESW